MAMPGVAAPVAASPAPAAATTPAPAATAAAVPPAETAVAEAPPKPAVTSAAGISADSGSIFFDLAIGPALGVGRTSESYGLGYAPNDKNENPDAMARVVREERSANIDVIATVSPYWEPRSYKKKPFDQKWLIPRPMIGISLLAPSERLYLGLSVDPLQYLNISGGVRIGTTQRLIGPQVGDSALLNSDGTAQEPVTRDETRASGFVAITVSNNLIYRWFKHAD